MNAAARLVHQNIISKHVILTHLLTRQQFGVMVLALAVLLSALSTIYITYVNRILHATYQRNVTELTRLNIQHGQLLLERSIWMGQSRIQQIAEKKLGMVIPDHTSAMIIHK